MIQNDNPEQFTPEEQDEKDTELFTWQEEPEQIKTEINFLLNEYTKALEKFKEAADKVIDDTIKTKERLIKVINNFK